MTRSYSQLSTWKTCPQQFKFHYVEGLPEPSTPAEELGTWVHSTLETFYGEFTGLDRTRTTLASCIPEEVPAEIWEEVNLLASNVFQIEDPSAVETMGQEFDLWHLDENLNEWRGIIDRVDIDPVTLGVTLVDYKTGKPPRELHKQDKLDQARMYAYLWWMNYGKIPEAVKFYYLREPTVTIYRPTEAALRAYQRRATAVVDCIGLCAHTDTWLPKPSPLCNWCSYQALCPLFAAPAS